MIRVGFFDPLWTQGGHTRGRVVAALAVPPDVPLTFSATAIKTSYLFDAVAAVKMSAFHKIYCHEPLPDGLGVPTGDVLDSHQRVIDQSDVLFVRGMTKEDRQWLDRLDWRGKPVVASSHGCCRWTTDTLANVLPYSTHYYAVSVAALRSFPRPLWDKVEVIYNGVDLNRVMPVQSRAAVRTDWGVRPDERVVLYLGRMADDKNVVAAAQAARALGKGWRAVYVGGGYAAERLTAAVRAISPDAVFVPAVEQVGDVLGAADVMVMATPSEGHCTSVIEAWAARLPVVSTPVGAVPELEDRFGPMVERVRVDATPGELAAACLAATDASFSPVLDTAERAVKRHMSAAVFGTKLADFCVRVANREPPRKVLWVADVPNWSFDMKTRDYARHLPFSSTTKFASSRVPAADKFLNADRHDAVVLLHHTELRGDALPSYVKARHAEGTGVGCCINFAPRGDEWVEVLERLRHYDAVASNNPKTMADMRAYGLDPYYTPDGFPADVFRVTTPFAQRPFAVCWVASHFRLEHKGLSIWKAARERLEGQGIEFVEVTSDSFNNSRLWPEVATIYNRCKVYACLSESEGGPAPLFESAACGCVPISTRVGVAPTFKSIRLIDRTVDAFCAQLVYLRDHPDELAALSAGAMADAATYRSDVVAPLWGLFVEACMRPGRRPVEGPFGGFTAAGAGLVRFVSGGLERVISVSPGATYAIRVDKLLATGTTAAGLSLLPLQGGKQ